VEVRQNIVVMNLVKETIEQINKIGKKIGAGIASALSLGTINLSGNETDTLGELMGSAITGKDN
jgi:hypothetical protein